VLARVPIDVGTGGSVGVEVGGIRVGVSVDKIGVRVGVVDGKTGKSVGSGLKTLQEENNKTKVVKMKIYDVFENMRLGSLRKPY
jgi:hypothetical protein